MKRSKFSEEQAVYAVRRPDSRRLCQLDDENNQLKRPWSISRSASTF
jgi:hypothetical protein